MGGSVGISALIRACMTIIFGVFGTILGNKVDNRTVKDFPIELKIAIKSAPK
jgi:hypothetical protein